MRLNDEARPQRSAASPSDPLATAQVLQHSSPVSIPEPTMSYAAKLHAGLNGGVRQLSGNMHVEHRNLSRLSR